MESTLSPRLEVPSPSDVHELLSQHILADGFDMVLDLERSHGPYLYDSLNEVELLDYFSSFSSNPLGYNHPFLTSDAFRERLVNAAVNKPANSDLYTVEMAAFVEAFGRTVPTPLRDRLFFVSGGALAVENAMKAAFDWKRRKNLAAGRSEKGTQIIHFREAFHGRSGYTLSVTNTDPTKTMYFPKFEWPRISNPKLRFPIDETVLAEVEKAEETAIEEIRAAVREHGHDIAALLIEPIQGEGGDNHFRREFLQALRDLADEHEFLLLFDEVQTGFGTTGRWWCFEHFDVVPDIFAFGKKTQVCGIAATERLDEVESVFQVSSRINSTWGGNLVDMVRCNGIIAAIEEEGLLERTRRCGERLLAGLRALEESHPGQLTNSRGRGLFLAFDTPSPEIRAQALHEMREERLLGLASGERSIRFRPPLVLEDGHVDEGLERIERALSRVL